MNPTDTTSSYMDFTPEVFTAIRDNAPVVALESTIIAHGMPYPENIQTALELETIVRSEGAVPATIAVLGGRIQAGLSHSQLEILAQGKDILKSSRRDLPMILAKKLSAATTVASTMICADLAGIRIFATGGIGGVHRDAAVTFDISADLQELAKTKVAVISAGAKSILDLPLTMEYLETLGVPVIGYQTSEFPAFFTRKSGIHLDYRVETPEEAADIIHVKWNLGLKGGIIIANPVPEAFSMDKREIDLAINQALTNAAKFHIHGKHLTPFLLDAIKKLTQGKSLKTNIALARNNVLIASRIAVAYSRLNP